MELPSQANFVENIFQTKSQPAKRANSPYSPTAADWKHRYTVKTQPCSSDDGLDSDSESKTSISSNNCEDKRSVKYVKLKAIQLQQGQQKQIQKFKEKAELLQKEGKQSFANIVRKAIVISIKNRESFIQEINRYKTQLKELEEWCLIHRPRQLSTKNNS